MNRVDYYTRLTTYTTFYIKLKHTGGFEIFLCVCHLQKYRKGFVQFQHVSESFLRSSESAFIQLFLNDFLFHCRLSYPEFQAEFDKIVDNIISEI